MVHGKTADELYCLAIQVGLRPGGGNAGGIGGGGCVIVPVMELLLQSWVSRIVIKCAVSYFVILWIGEKLYRREK